MNRGGTDECKIIPVDVEIASLKDIRNVHFTIFILSPTLKTSNNKILEKPGVTGKGNIIQSFCIIS
jgi:hypothetical protein